MLRRYTAVGFKSSPGIGLCSSCSLYYCSQTFFEAWPVESRTKSAGAKVLRVIKFWSTRGLKNDPFFFFLDTVALCFCVMQKSSKSLCRHPIRKSSDLLFGASYRRRTQGLDMKTSVSEP